MNVKQRADAVGTFRHMNVFLMETLAAWIPSVPEMEAKILLGRHLWLLAQMADRLGKRTRELRAPMHFSRAPEAAFATALAALAALGPTASRLRGFYATTLAALDNGYATYLADTDPIMDEPTVVIIEDARRDVARMKDECAQLLKEFPALAAAPAAVEELERLFARSPGMVAASTEPQPA